MQITITIQESGDIEINYPKEMTIMETVGVLETSKMIMLKPYLFSGGQTDSNPFFAKNQEGAGNGI